jgi:hypothetical protein
LYSISHFHFCSLQCLGSMRQCISTLVLLFCLERVSLSGYQLLISSGMVFGDVQPNHALVPTGNLIR